MKLLIFCPYYPPHIGGLESHANEFNRYLSQKGIDITVFTPRLPKKTLELEIKYNNVQIIRFPAFEIVANYPLPKFWSPKFWRLFFRLFQQKFDIIVSRTRFFNTSLLAFIYAKIKKVRWIHIEHGSDFVKLNSNFKSAIAKLYDYTFGRLIFKTSDLNISISRSVQNFVYKFDRRESPIIYRGLDLNEIDKINPDKKIKEKYQDKIIISFVGRLYKWKGVKNSILAIKSLPQEIKKKTIFLIIGDGEDFSQLKKISRKEFCIEMLGNLPREKAIAILKISDIYIHSAYPGGGLSTSLLEAMYCGCTIIATPYEGAAEVITDQKNGFLMSPEDNKFLRNKLKFLIENINQYQDKKMNNPAQLKEKFEWNNSIEKYLTIFKRYV